jgi:hypothetical protein
MDPNHQQEPDGRCVKVLELNLPFLCQTERSRSDKHKDGGDEEQDTLDPNRIDGHSAMSP